MSPTGLHRWLPRLILAAAAAHLAVGAVESAPHWRDMLSEGLWNTVANDDAPRMMALWFMFSGVALVGLGLLARRSVLATGALPVEIGWLLLLSGVPVALLEPVSGGWVLLTLGTLAVYATRRSAPDRP
ncbi:hypothetical protein GCM10009678_73350 [Actinomadura kijaniata]|uniref:Uncharacterized protein n=1 Tax=Actinomadura namibiensis TaxID=182080 RepID=A0A7W3LTZ9_ACTNM|nr:DUF6463 family protein [Actinomadura namibiensis]MBA8954234.1 hypothetical protein [Actinomadura namibiensis]